MKKKATIVTFATFLCLLLFTPLYSSETKKKAEDYEKLPERALSMAAEFPGIEIPPGESVNMNITFFNRGRTPEVVELKVVSKPENWRTRFKSDVFTITSVSVPWGEDKTIVFEAEPDRAVRPGDYTFVIEAKTPDEKIVLNQKILVKVREYQRGVARGIRLSAAYPVLKGPSDAKFEFSVEAENKLDRDAVFNLSAHVPEGWEVNFKPAYEYKTISSLKLKANSSQTITVEVTPYKDSKPGSYPVIVRAAYGDIKAEIPLTVVITGTYSIDAGTLTGLLSLEAQQGKKTTITVFLKNTGSATLTNISFTSFKPENWKVEFNPERIAVLEPNQVKQVEVSITPYEDALVGDYSVGMNIDAGRATKNLEFRVTVRARAVWGWIGVGIIAFVLVGLMVLFRTFGRR
ncbi:MAG: NEW3 domain-containing protein [Desulfobacterota bacterium]|nr:NEW3 domain-containing protein [Thermodesulfobacteriota bacterium]MDW8001100.1 NEW3 domain-containing protein [Deltaproteobacteria bacterium]